MLKCFTFVSFCCLSLFITTVTCAQKINSVHINSPREKGLIVLSSGDTLSGQISYSRYKHLYSKIKFERDTEKVFKQYNSQTLRAFYLSESNQLFISGDSLKKFASGNLIGSEGNFLKALVTGRASLYQFLALSKPTYYMTTEQMAVLLDKGLENSKHIDGRLYKLNEKPFQKTLKKLLSDCIRDTLLTLKYNESELVGLIDKYNRCSNSPSKMYGSESKKVLLGVTAGYLISNLSFIDKNARVRPYGYSTLAPYGSYDLSPLLNQHSESTSFYAGISLSVLFADNKHFSFNSQFIFVNRKWDSDLFKIDAQYIDIPMTFQYNFNIDNKFQPTLGLGVDFATSVKSKLENDDLVWDFYREPAKNGSTDTWPAVIPVTMPAIFENEFKPTMIVPVVTAGFDIVNKNSIVSLNYKIGYPASITNSPLYKSSVSNQLFSVTVSGLFKKNRN